MNTILQVSQIHLFNMHKLSILHLIPRIVRYAIFATSNLCSLFSLCNTTDCKYKVYPIFNVFCNYNVSADPKSLPLPHPPSPTTPLNPLHFLVFRDFELRSWRSYVTKLFVPRFWEQALLYVIYEPIAHSTAPQNEVMKIRTQNFGYALDNGAYIGYTYTIIQHTQVVFSFLFGKISDTKRSCPDAAWQAYIGGLHPAFSDSNLL